MNRKRHVLAALALLACTLGYGLFQARTLLSGPIINIRSPLPGELITENLYTIVGTAQNVSRVRINDRPINTDLSGRFEQTMVTPDGYASIRVRAEDRLGNTTEEVIPIVGRPPAIIAITDTESGTATSSPGNATSSPSGGAVE